MTEWHTTLAGTVVVDGRKIQRWYATDGAGISLVGPFNTQDEAQAVCDKENRKPGVNVTRAEY